MNDTASVSAAVAAVAWPTNIAGEFPPAAAGYFVGRRSPAGGIDRHQWHADRSAAIGDAASTPEEPTYFAIGLHYEARTCSADTLAVLGGVFVDADVEHVGADGKVRHAGAAKNGDGAEAAIAQAPMPAPAVIIRTSDTDGRQGFWQLDRWADCDDAALVLDAMRARVAKGGKLDTSVYNLHQWIRVGGPGCRVVHVNTGPTTVDADELIGEAEAALAATVPRAPRANQGRPGDWANENPEVLIGELHGAGWTGPVGRTSELRNGATRQLFKHPTASYPWSAELLLFTDGLSFRCWSENTAFEAGKWVDAVGALGVLHGVDPSGVAAWLMTLPECKEWVDARRKASDPGTGHAKADTSVLDEDMLDRLGRVPLGDRAWWDNDGADPEDWLIYPVVPRERGVALYAAGGVGKSLIVLWLCAERALGRRGLSPTNAPPIVILYVDAEMTEHDLRERLTSMGYTVDDGLAARLHYLSLPDLPPLDTYEGGQVLLNAAKAVGADVVVLDTYQRTVGGTVGNENDSAPTLAYYQHTGGPLKAAGIAVIRIDHAGYDGSHARGTSAKRDDVDIVWQLTRRDGAHFTLKADKRRLQWVPETVDLVQFEEPLRYALVGGAGWPAGTAAVAILLDELRVPVDASTRAAEAAVRAAGHSHGNRVIRAALRYRKSGERPPQSAPGATMAETANSVRPAHFGAYDSKDS